MIRRITLVSDRSRLERERIHLLLLDEAEKGLTDVAAGRVKDGRKAIARRRAKRSAGV